MLNCADATRRISEGLDRSLSWRARLGLRMHLFMCSACRRFRRQLVGLERIVRGRSHATEEAGYAQEGLSSEARESIKRRLRG